MKNNILKEKFIGTWKLVSYEVKDPDGKIEYPNGKPLGYIMYNQDGYMSVVIMDENRKKFNKEVLPFPEFWQTISSDKKAEAFETYFSYCGLFEVKDDKFVVHHLEASLIPDWIGTDQIRQYKFDGDVLTLSTSLNDKIATLVWKRV